MLTDTCQHCGEQIEINPVHGMGLHTTGSHTGLGRCGKESNMPYGLNAHSRDVECNDTPCMGQYWQEFEKRMSDG